MHRRTLTSRCAQVATYSITYFLLFSNLSPSTPFTYATELDSILNSDHNHHRLSFAQHQLDELGLGGPDNDVQNEGYQPDFPGANRWIIGRQEQGGGGATNLENNKGIRQTIEKGGAMYSQFAANSAQNVWVTVNVCSQPISNGSDIPQLTLYTSGSNTRPGPDNDQDTTSIPLDQGFAEFETSTASQTLYIGVSAPDLTSGQSGGWAISIAASTDAPYHSLNSGEVPWRAMDSDANSVLVTTNTTDPNEFLEYLPDDQGNPYTMFLIPSNSTIAKGMEKSYCGLRTAAVDQMKLDISSDVTIRSMGPNQIAQQQVYIQGLNASYSYLGYWAQKANGDLEGSSDVAAINGGGILWGAGDALATKPTGNCQIIFDLKFCTEVAYAVPANPTLFNSTALAQKYDQYAESMYQGFNYSLQQIACDAPNTAQYSLARNCTHCAEDYKNWLCAVTIPRCRDLSDEGLPGMQPGLQPRSLGYNLFNGTALPEGSPWANQSLKESMATNRSRNTMIDDDIKPGPYKELLPCRDLCYSLIRSCPASFGFGCPSLGKMMDVDYGTTPFCNDPKELFDPSAGVKLQGHGWLLLGCVVGVAFLVI